MTVVCGGDLFCGISRESYNIIIKNKDIKCVCVCVMCVAFFDFLSISWWSSTKEFITINTILVQIQL
jgi:hypothetical protein